MKRALLAVVATVAGIAGLLSFKTHGTERSGVTAQPSALPSGERAVTGAVANTAYGPVQVQAVFRGKRIVAVNILRKPTSTENDIQIGQFAFPKLTAETITAQSARIDSVSGATYTSGGYIKSLQSVLDHTA
jgi:uncharacterized protein with FMN-binding domain